MGRRWNWGVIAAVGFATAGCAQPDPRPEYVEVAQAVHATLHRPIETIAPDDPDAARLDPPTTPPELTGPQPVEAYIARALSENRAVQAARYNVLALRSRIPQVTALEDPMVSNVIYPIPSAAPQYSLMGYNPYNLMLSQQFPWCGTLRLRGEAAEEEVKVALAQLAAAELDAVAAVKRAYYDLAFNQQAETIFQENRRLASDFLELARTRYKTGATPQQDVLRADVAISELDREIIRVGQALTLARADLARQLHLSPESDLRAIPGLPSADVPAEIDRLYRLAVAARPELRGRLAAIARDAREVELARQRYYPNITLGLSYMDMERTNAVTPRTASGTPNVGLVVGFNLPIYRQKLAAGVCEAQARAVADARMYEAERDATYREVKDLLTQVGAQRDILELFRASILPKSQQALKAAAADYQAGSVDYVTLISAWREVLQIRLQSTQVEAELGKALASLERAVGVELNNHPPDPRAVRESNAPAANGERPPGSA